MAFKRTTARQIAVSIFNIIMPVAVAIIAIELVVFLGIAVYKFAIGAYKFAIGAG